MKSCHGPNIASDTPGADRADYGEVVLERRLRVPLLIIDDCGMRKLPAQHHLHFHTIQFFKCCNDH